MLHWRLQTERYSCARTRRCGALVVQKIELKHRGIIAAACGLLWTFRVMAIGARRPAKRLSPSLSAYSAYSAVENLNPEYFRLILSVLRLDSYWLRLRCA